MTSKAKFKVGQHVFNNDKASFYFGREVLITSVNCDWQQPIYYCQSGNVTMTLGEKEVKNIKYED